jgi:pimeloyl-ACP methyl ester carboxylesterase
MLTTASALVAPQPAPPFTLLHVPAKGRGALACWLALPPKISTEAPPLVAIHGIQRDDKDQARLLAARAAAEGRPVIAPLFDARNWPRYQQVVRNKRADLAMLALMADLRLAGVWRTRTFDLSGYSGGAQFAHRFAMLYPNLVAQLTVASAGWYTFPDLAVFPYGLAARPGRADDWGPRFAAGLDQFLRLPIQVCVGAEDNIPDPNTRSAPEIDKQQGRDRVTRAARWAATLRQAASARAITPRVALAVLPGCGHNFRACIQRGRLDRLILPGAEKVPVCPDLAREEELSWLPAS